MKDIHIEKLAFSVSEAAIATGLSKDAIYQLVYAGKIEHVPFGKKIIIPKWAIEKWLKENVCTGRSTNERVSKNAVCS